MPIPIPVRAHYEIYQSISLLSIISISVQAPSRPGRACHGQSQWLPCLAVTASLCHCLSKSKVGPTMSHCPWAMGPWAHGPIRTNEANESSGRVVGRSRAWSMEACPQIQKRQETSAATGIIASAEIKRLWHVIKLCKARCLGA